MSVLKLLLSTTRNEPFFTGLICMAGRSHTTVKAAYVHPKVMFNTGEHMEAIAYHSLNLQSRKPHGTKESPHPIPL